MMSGPNTGWPFPVSFILLFVRCRWGNFRDVPHCCLSLGGMFGGQGPNNHHHPRTQLQNFKAQDCQAVESPPEIRRQHEENPALPLFSAPGGREHPGSRPWEVQRSGFLNRESERDRAPLPESELFLTDRPICPGRSRTMLAQHHRKTLSVAQSAKNWGRRMVEDRRRFPFRVREKVG